MTIRIKRLAIPCLLCLLLPTLGGRVYAQAAPPAGAWVQSAPPAPPGQSALMAQDPYQPPGYESRPLFEGNAPLFSNPFTGQDTPAGQRLFQNWGVDLSWITADKGPNRMGLFRIAFAGDIAFPLFALERPLFFEPKFAVNYWDGPGGTAVFDMPPQTFDAALGLRWQPVWKPRFMPAQQIDFDLYFSVGLYADFRKVSGHSFRFPSYGYASLKLTNNIHLKLGVKYLDRVRVRILPSGGLVWKPSQRWTFELLFPDPRISYFPQNAAMSSLELYLRGEYGGGSWTVNHAEGGLERTDYNDYRIMLGANWAMPRRGAGTFEIGLSFARELYIDGPGSYSLDPGFVMRAELRF